jgi:hypothetical protein
MPLTAESIRPPTCSTRRPNSSARPVAVNERPLDGEPPERWTCAAAAVERNNPDLARDRAVTAAQCRARAQYEMLAS